nr:hypothetical protein [Phaeacidiphilus oryzae]
MAEAHGGSLDLSSRPGSTAFTLRLPRQDGGSDPDSGSE